MKGRRPSAPYPTVPVAGGRLREPTKAETEMHNRINLIRDRVDAWREDGYPGINPDVARLLRYWNGDNHAGIRPFFCQVTAIETLVWLCDADESVDDHLPKIRSNIRDACQKHNGDVLRYATKMATGTGKTIVMGMIIAWQAMRNLGRTDILVMVPNLTVKGRLSVLQPGDADNVYKDILPRGTNLPDDIRVSIINYQAFRPRSTLDIDPEKPPADSKTKQLITGGAAYPDHWLESPPTMLDRLLRPHRGASEIVVLNDEAHHCYRPDKSDARGANDEIVKPKDAAMWFGALTHLHNEGKLGMVFDMSATPRFISNTSRADTELFPWVVSNYPLIDAIEAGLTKIPRVPVRDSTGYEEPKFRNIYAHMRRTDRKLHHESMHDDVKDLLHRLEIKYTEEFNRYTKHGRLPVMIVVAYPIDNAKAIYKHLAGYRDGDSWKEGYEMFSNVKDGKPMSTPATLLVTSDLDNLDDKAWGDLAIVQNEFFKDAIDKKERKKHIRNVFQTVGQKGKPGEHIRCVVSVNMLTEGWDAKTVTHVFGYRPFKSDLLCEQVAGRALRRSSLPSHGNGDILPPEYAGIFGIPFSFMMGTGKSTDPPPSWEVRTEPGRERFRMTFPHIRGYEISSGTVVLKFDAKEVKDTYNLKSLLDKSGDVMMAGPTGEWEKLTDLKRAHTAIFELAARITERYGTAGTGRTAFFQSAVVAVHEWLKHPNVTCEDERLLAYNPNIETAAKAIWRASTTFNERPPVRPVFANEGNTVHQHELDTDNIRFSTTSKHRYPPDGGIAAKSELNLATCDSPEEVKIARFLDKHKDVEAWVRNVGLGWSIPYIDPTRGGYREYVPDFVARLRGGRTHLVIEYKGQDTADSQIKKNETEDKWIPAVNASDDSACAGQWRYVFIDNEARIGTELNEAIVEGLR